MPECKDQKRAAQKAGDRYYSAVTRWLISEDRSDGEKGQAYILARAYNKTLELLRRCYERLRRRDPAVEKKLEQTIELQELVQKDLTVLGGQTPKGEEA